MGQAESLQCSALYSRGGGYMPRVVGGLMGESVTMTESKGGAGGQPCLTGPCRHSVCEHRGEGG